MSLEFIDSTYVLPEQQISNSLLATKFPDWNIDKAAAKTGVYSRHAVTESTTALDLAEQACNKLFALHPQVKEQIDYLLFCTQSPDYSLPPNCTQLQHRLGLPSRIGALDFTHGCSGFIYGLSLASALATAGQATTILLVTAETYSRLLHPQDASNHNLFGDAATATLLRANPHTPGPQHFSFLTEGAGAQQLFVPASGSKVATTDAMLPTSLLTTAGKKPEPGYLYMNGPAVLRYTLNAVPHLITTVLEKAQLSHDDIDIFLFHQANGYALEHLRRRCEIAPNKLITEFSDIGNTVSNSIPIAWKRAMQRHLIHSGQTILFVGFGVGYSSAACLWRLP